MNYTKNALITKNPADVLQAAKDYFVHQNFKILSANANSISAENNLFRCTTNADPMTFITKIDISIYGNELKVEYEIGGVREMGRFLVALIGGLAILFSAIFIPMLILQGKPKILWIPFAPLALWIIIGPLMLKFIKNRTISSIDVFVSNMTFEPSS